MSRISRTIILFASLAFSVMAQLSVDQKVVDFQTIVALYAKQYAPYEWKRDNENFDLYQVSPWVERIRASKTDLEYLQIVAEYVASLNDAHTGYQAPSSFTADLHLYTDIYDGKVLIESIDRSYLPASTYPFAVGDEIVEFDGRPVFEVVAELARTNAFANSRATRRYATDLLVYRPQSVLPMTALLGDSATLLVRRASGAEETYTIPWDKNGFPLINLGPVPDVKFSRNPRGQTSRGEDAPADEPSAGRPMNRGRKLLARMQQNALPGAASRHLVGFGSRTPIFRLPATFTQRLGRVSSDFFFSGIYTAGDKRIGFLRIPSFQPIDFSLLDLPLSQWEREIAYLKANTDGLVIDVMRNPGGYGCYAADLISYLTPNPFFTFGNEVRPTRALVQDFYDAVQDTDLGGYEDWEVILLKAAYRDVLSAYTENRGRTGPVPFCAASLDSLPATGSDGAPLAYDKPMLVLTDEFTASSGDIFAAMAQDNNIAKTYGYRTTGAGGSVDGGLAGFYSEGAATVTGTMLTRNKAYTHPGYPATYYIENVGVEADFADDYMTRDNLMNRGAAFVTGFTSRILALIAEQAR